MTSALDHLYELHINPFLFARAMLAFFESLGEKEQSILLAYLVLPIALDRENREFLSRAKGNSSLRTFASKPERLRALPERVEAYRENTNATLRYLISLKAIRLSDRQIVVDDSVQLPDGTSPDGLVSAATTLGRFFRDYQVPAVYRMVGVMAL